MRTDQLDDPLVLLERLLALTEPVRDTALTPEERTEWFLISASAADIREGYL